MNRCGWAALAVMAAIGTGACGAQGPESDDAESTAAELSDVRLASRYTECEVLPEPERDAERRFRVYRYKAKGREALAGGLAGGAKEARFSSRWSCENVPFRALPKAYFYGNVGTWGWLGLDDQANLYRSEDQVVGRYRELCAQVRSESGLGQDMPCHADLIAYTPNGYIRKTEELATRLADAEGATLSIDFRGRASTTWPELTREIERLFKGESVALSREFLETHRVGLSLDLEPQIGPSEGVGIYGFAEASVVNTMCDTYRQIMIGYGHDPAGLECFLYEYAKPTMVLDPEHLAPYVHAVLMSGVSVRWAQSETAKKGLRGSTENWSKVGLEGQREWIDRTRRAYGEDKPFGCMFYSAPYLRDTQRNPFTFADASAHFADVCDIYSFQ